ncbi:hypothetical protein [Singulisphaera sp. PoT]|uniref:hypothetical protein n=1 Tax=Singulisphaera sp. PoT TaxID=3411797 RepID=UPI003BF4B3FD
MRRKVDLLSQDKEDAVRLYRAEVRVASYLRTLVNEKFQRVRLVLQGSNASRGTIGEVRAALVPDVQIKAILESLVTFLRSEIGSPEGHKHNFRVGLYVEKGGKLEPVEAFDLNTSRPDPFTSYRQHAERFDLGNTANPSYAVVCVQLGRMLIVEDCEHDPDFHHFTAAQINYLRSLVAYPMLNFCLDGNTPARAVLMIDTNVTGHFKEDARDKLESLIEGFAARLSLEYAIKRLVR